MPTVRLKGMSVREGMEYGAAVFTWLKFCSGP
jgi:hypothetical protein